MKNIKFIFPGVIILVILALVGLNFGRQQWQKRMAENNSKVALRHKVGLQVAKSVTKKEPEKFDIKLLFSPVPIQESVTYEVKSGDSLYSIAKEFGTTIDLIIASNNLKEPNIQAGQKLKIIKGEFKIAVDTTNNILTLFLNNKLVKIYPVATAKNRNTPLGEFKIVNKIINPTWYAPDGVYPYGDPKNILGTRWMGIDEPSYGIHGTTEPGSIGKYASAGCIRMYNEDVEELYKIVPEGIKVIILK